MRIIITFHLFLFSFNLMAQENALIYIDASSGQKLDKIIQKAIDIDEEYDGKSILYLSNDDSPFISTKESTLVSTLDQLIDNDVFPPINIIDDIVRINDLILKNNFINNISEDIDDNCYEFKSYIIIDEEQFLYGSFSADKFLQVFTFCNNLKKCNQSNLFEIIIIDDEDDSNINKNDIDYEITYL